ncbi:MAG: hypothetical protein AABX27_00575 [Nanoarchaeota archaeon]
MDEKLKKALETVRIGLSQETSDASAYLSACEYLAQHREELTQRVYVQLPGGLRGNSDPRWDKVRENSESRCGCGNERVIFPGNPRTKYEPSDLGEIVISPENAAYLKPVGGDKESAYVKLWIEGDSLAFMCEPFAPLVLTPDIFSTKGYKLEQLAEVLPKQKKPPVFAIGREKAPIFGINAVDVAARNVTITLDKAVESFNPDNYTDAHACTK